MLNSCAIPSLLHTFPLSMQIPPLNLFPFSPPPLPLLRVFPLFLAPLELSPPPFSFPFSNAKIAKERNLPPLKNAILISTRIISECAPPPKKKKNESQTGVKEDLDCRISFASLSQSLSLSLPSPHFVSSPLFPLTRHFVRERDFDDDEEEEEEGEEIKQEVSLYSPSPPPLPSSTSRLSSLSRVDTVCSSLFYPLPRPPKLLPAGKKEPPFFSYILPSVVSRFGRECFCQFSGIRTIINAHNEPRFVNYGTIYHVHTRQERENPLPSSSWH